MIPSVRQWMPLSDDILVYPLSRYTITGNKRSRTTSADEYFRRIRLLHKKITISRRYKALKNYGRGNGKLVVTGHDVVSNDDTDSDSHRSGSISTSSTSTCRTQNSSSLFRDSDSRSRSHSDQSPGYDDHPHSNRSRRRRRSHHRYNDDDHEIHGSQTAPDRRSRYLMPSVYCYNGRIVDAFPDSGRGTTATNTTIHSITSNHCVTRCSANIVILAHGNRSLHVLMIQRSQQTYNAQHRNRIYTVPMTTASCTTVAVRYKLPGGRLMLTDDEQQKYRQEHRNTCTCPDDYRWYATALEHFMKQSLISTVLEEPPSQPTNAVNDLQHIVLLGKWYRTQDKETRRRTDHGYSLYHYNHNPQCYYYPYKPAHISHQTVEHKRVYAVPDTQRLHAGHEMLRLRTPPIKIRTFTGPDGTMIIRTTTYKYKFVPLARLYENNRLYGPILSSLPVILSGMNLIWLP